MAKSEQTPIIKLPVKITLTSEGVEWFIRNNKQIKRLRMADNRLEYGISLEEFSAASLQKMMNIEYISTVEIARTEFADKRREIIDLNKLIVYRILYRSFERETYKLFLDSPLIKRWNRAHPTRIIDENSVFNRSQLESLFSSCAPDLPMVSEDIQSRLLKELQADPRLSGEEREVLEFLADKYVMGMRNIMRCVLAKSRGEPEYMVLVAKVVGLLRGYLDKSKIAEYLSLMVTELLTYAEAVHAAEIGRKLFPEMRSMSGVLRNPKLREAIVRSMREHQDYLYLTYQVSSKVPSIGTENRLRIVIFNHASEYQKVKEQIEIKAGVDIKEKSLVEFYGKMPPEDIDTELGLYYLSFLHAECARCNVHLDSRVSELPARELTVINLTLQF
jgi:hypothetical protein